MRRPARIAVRVVAVILLGAIVIGRAGPLVTGGRRRILSRRRCGATGAALILPTLILAALILATLRLIALVLIPLILTALIGAWRLTVGWRGRSAVVGVAVIWVAIVLIAAWPRLGRGGDAALSARGRYTGGASPRTWLTGILKHKIIDLIRRQAREVEMPRDEDGAEDWEALFKADGHWASPPREWRSPENEAQLAQLRLILLECTDGLKPAMARVFSLREVVGLETEEICKELNISPTNCWVLLHRARLFLRECLELNGFSGASS